SLSSRSSSAHPRYRHSFPTRRSSDLSALPRTQSAGINGVMANPSAEHTSAPVNPQHAGTDAELPHQAPELHITAERGVLEAPAGAVFADGAIHVFHQFRTKRSNGSRWAHVTAPPTPYDWDIPADVLKPEAEELDVLAGSALALPAADGTPETVELIFVTSEPRDANASREELLGSQVANGRRGERTFRI